MAQEKTVILKLVVSGFGEASKDLEFMTTETAKLNTEKKKLTTESNLAARAITAEEGSIEKLRAQTALLRQEANNMAGVTAKEISARTQLTTKIAENTQKIRDHDRAMSGSSTLVGEYEKGFTAAFGKIGNAIAGIAIPAAAAAYALNGLKEAFAGTEAGANLLGRAKLQMTAFFDAIVEGRWKYAFGNELPKDIRVIADLMNKIRIEERAELVAVSEKELEIKDLRIDAIKAGKDSVKQVELLTLAEQKQGELIQIKLNHKGEELFYVNKLLEKDKENTNYLDRQAQLQADINNILGERSLRIASKLEAAQQKETIKLEEELTDAKVSGIRAVILAEQEQMQQENRKKISDTPTFGITGVLAVKLKKDTQETVNGIGNIIDKANANLEKDQAGHNRIELDMAQKTAESKMNIANSAVTLLTAISGKSKTIQKAAIITERAVAIAEIIMKARIANMATTAWGAAYAIPTAGASMVAAGIINAKNKIAEIFNIGAVVAATVMGFVKGGRIIGGLRVTPDSKGDNTLILARQGEVVLNESQQQRLGGATALRKVGVPGFASGGLVGGVSYSPGLPFDMEAIMDKVVRGFNDREVTLNLNKLNTAQKTLDLIVQTSGI